MAMSAQSFSRVLEGRRYEAAREYPCAAVASATGTRHPRPPYRRTG